MKFVPLLGRILYSAIFILFGFGHFTETDAMREMIPQFLPAPTLIVYVTGVVIIVSGVMVLIGYRARQAALCRLL